MKANPNTISLEANNSLKEAKRALFEAEPWNVTEQDALVIMNNFMSKIKSIAISDSRGYWSYKVEAERGNENVNQRWFTTNQFKK